ncbi:hypothetical protein J7426_01580 [Tropicibacter sp. R16_0]|uniref:DUF5906 domain-containing protein n=1 Tax=Tropicibacter sp. R16_0 TaxID=2821102 RepID=UPI001ADBC631|nr:DUF5906 domain-containing protein [Tropicibacter sp. R16_0]MBO9448928.1 hypothetical protein [Tropicibacter sp. R16_0]
MSDIKQTLSAVRETAETGRRTETFCPRCNSTYKTLTVHPGAEELSVFLECSKKCGKAELELLLEEHESDVAYSQTKGIDPTEPLMLKAAPVAWGLPPHEDHASVFKYQDRDGNLLACVVRVDNPDGTKDIRPWTPVRYPDGKQGWHMGYPEQYADGKKTRKPLYRLRELEGMMKKVPVMIHEGEKACDAARAAAGDEAHPWSEWLRQFAHVSLMGGAKAIGTANLRPLSGHPIWISRDKDDDGLDSGLMLAELLDPHCPAVYLSDPDYFEALPAKWDMADGTFGVRAVDFSKRFLLRTPPYYEDITENGQFLYPFNRKFAKLFAVLTNRDTVCELRNLGPDCEVTSSTFKSYYMQPKAAAKNAFDQVIASGRAQLVYDYGTNPSLPYGALYVESGQRYANVYRGPDFDPVECTEEDLAVFFEYMAHLIPDEKERKIALAWFAMVAGNKRDTRGFLWSVCAISKQTGSGKTLFGFLLAKLVGSSCHSEITVAQFRAPFNEWYRGKRLITVNEAREPGNSPWGFTESLKPYITDEYISIAEKYRGKTQAKNHAYWYLSSNHDSAINIDDSDRRYFVPTITEHKIPADLNKRLRRWFDEGGAAQLLGWAQREAERIFPLIDTPEGRELGYTTEAPATERKAELQERGRSEVAVFLDEYLGEGVSEKMVVSSQDVRDFLKERIKDHDINKPRGRLDIQAVDALKALGYRRVWAEPQTLFAISGVNCHTKLSLWSKHDFGKDPNRDVVRNYYQPLSTLWSSRLNLMAYDPRDDERENKEEGEKDTTLIDTTLGEKSGDEQGLLTGDGKTRNKLPI